MRKNYPQLSQLAFRILLPFATTYLCESGFSALVAIKTKARNRRRVEHDMRLTYNKHSIQNFQAGYTVVKSTIALNAND